MMRDSQIEQHRVFGDVIDILEAMGIDYMIWGGVAVITYGEPRFTQDMDVVVRLHYSQIDTLSQVLKEDGYYVSVEAIRDAIERHFYFNAIHQETGIKIDFHVAGPDPLLSWAFRHRHVKDFDEIRQAAYMPPESVILTKLHTFRDSGSDRHLRDVEGILRVSGSMLDWDYISREAVRLGVFGLWRELAGRVKLSKSPSPVL